MCIFVKYKTKEEFNFTNCEAIRKCEQFQFNNSKVDILAIIYSTFIIIRVSVLKITFPKYFFYFFFKWSAVIGIVNFVKVRKKRKFLKIGQNNRANTIFHFCVNCFEDSDVFLISTNGALSYYVCFSN